MPSIPSSAKSDLDADVVVVGAGPAGSAAAARLARAGHDVLVVDRVRFPRDKFCGDFVGPVALRELELLGIDRSPVVREANAVPMAGLFLDGEHLITFPFPQADGLAAFGRVIPRLAFDEAVFGAARDAGARHVEAAATGLRVSGDYADVVVRQAGAERVLRARLVIGADGSGSSIARIVRGRPPPRDDLIVAVRAYFTGVSGPADRCDVYFGGDSFPGYAWIFPTAPGFANVGVGMVSETFPQTHERLSELLFRLVRDDAGMRTRLAGARMVGRVEGWPLCTFDEALDVVGERTLLVGDAAGLINPLNGEGIQYALSSARWAADVAAGALSRDDCSLEALREYERRVRAELHEDVRFSRLLVRAIGNRSLNTLWLSMLRAIVARARRDAGYARVTGGVVAGIVPARDALAPSVSMRTLGAFAAAMLRWLRASLRRPSKVFDALASAAAPAIDAACDPIAARAWARRLGAALTDFTR